MNDYDDEIDDYPLTGSPAAMECEEDDHPPYSMGRCYCGEVSFPRPDGAEGRAT